MAAHSGRRCRCRYHPAYAFDKKSATPVTPPNDADDSELQLHHFEVVSDVLHYAIRELTAVAGFRSDVCWIAHALESSPVAVTRAIDRLLAIGLLRNEGGVLCKTARRIRTPRGPISAPALRHHQQQVLEKAARALETVPIEERVNVAMTMPIDPEQLPRARELIDRFVDDMSDLLTTHKRTRVYQLAIALFPLQKS